VISVTEKTEKGKKEGRKHRIFSRRHGEKLLTRMRNPRRENDYEEK
jgi:hypothetical protein